MPDATALSVDGSDDDILVVLQHCTYARTELVAGAATNPPFVSPKAASDAKKETCGRRTATGPGAWEETLDARPRTGPADDFGQNDPYT